MSDWLVTAVQVSDLLKHRPMVWKQAKVVMLPKPGKYFTKLTSYRPISLLSAMAKIFERIVASRLSTFLEKANYFDEHQAGFRKK